MAGAKHTSTSRAEDAPRLPLPWATSTDNSSEHRRSLPGLPGSLAD